MSFRMRRLELSVPLTIPDSGKRSLTDLLQKRTQTNPLRLSYFDTIIYAIFEENEPIEVNCFFFNVLRRKKARFLKNMDERLALTSPESKNSAMWRVTSGKMNPTPSLANEAGISLNSKKFLWMVACTIPDLPWAVTKERVGRGESSRILGVSGKICHIPKSMEGKQ